MSDPPNNIPLVPAQGPADTLDQHAAEIRRLGKRVVADVIEIGRRLTEAKALAAHGGWLPWLDREFGWDDRTARRFVQVFEWSLKSSGNLPDLELPISGIYLLAQDKTPEEARTEVIERAESGERITVEAVKTTIAKVRAPRADKAKATNRKGKPAAPPKAGLSSLAWSNATLEQRRHFLDGAGLASVQEAMPSAWRTDHQMPMPACESAERPSAPPAVAAALRAVEIAREKYIATMRAIPKERRIEEVEALVEKLGLWRDFSRTDGSAS